VLCLLQAVQAFVDGVSSRDKTFKQVEGGYHEMLMGDEKVDSTQGIIDWVRAHVDRPWQQQGDEAGRQQQQVRAQAQQVAEAPADSRL
jgi:trans-aconitate methyltransferase